MGCQLEEDLREERRLTSRVHALAEARGAELDCELQLRQLRDEQTQAALSDLQELQDVYTKAVTDYELQIAKVKAMAKEDLEEFKTVELARVKADFIKETQKIVRRNEMLEKEVQLCDNIAPHLQALRPLQPDA